MLNSEYLSNLNENQREAVECLDGPLLIVAGAGSGKTKVLTSRIAHIIKRNKAFPNQILAVTFTNKAAKEMQLRVSKLLRKDATGLPWLGTFHSISAKLLRKHADAVGLKSNFTIIDQDDQVRLIKNICKAENVDIKKISPKFILAIIDKWKNKGFYPRDVILKRKDPLEKNFLSIYKIYQEKLINLNSADFSDLILHTVKIFEKYTDIAELYSKKFKYILVDEYQDTNQSQNIWLKLLAMGSKNICCVGDDDQSIYGWRGAEVKNILSFEKDFANSKIVRLEQNYRSTPHILGAASSLISANSSRLGKKLWTNISEGEKVRLINHWDGNDEARWIGEEIESLGFGTRGMKPFLYNQIALLVRASFQMRTFEERFIQLGLPYRVIGGPRFYERKEIRDAIAYFRAIISFDDGLAFERILNTPKRGFGDKSMQILNELAREQNIGLMSAAKFAIDNGKLPSKLTIELDNLLKNFKRWNSDFFDKSKKHTEVAEMVLDESGYTEMWQSEKTPDSAGRLENLKELIKALDEFENMQGFLEHISLIMEMETDKDIPKISIMTLHAAKGLEFPVVFLPGWEDGLFPSQRSMDQKGKIGLEEERRLAHVGITRAEKYCVISFASNRRIFNQWQNTIPSRFINELSEENIEILESQNAFQSYSDGWSRTNEKDQILNHNNYNSPGWKRMSSNIQKKNFSLNKEFAPFIASIPENFTKGSRVFHQKFGYGIIEEINSDNVKVIFEKSDSKDIKASFLIHEDDV